MAAAATARPAVTRPSIWWIMRRLVQAGLLTPGTVAAFILTVVGSGTNLAALLHAAARRYGGAIALDDGETTVSFTDLAAECERMAAALRDAHDVRGGDVVGILCRNGGDAVRSVLASARLGTRVTLLNPEMSAPQLAGLIQSHDIRLVIAEADTKAAVAGSTCRVLDAADLLAEAPLVFGRIGRISGGELVVLTGGTTGAPKAARRKPSPRAFLLLFTHLVIGLELDRYPSVYVAVPLFHGFGIAAFLVALALGRSIYLTRHFNAAEACALVDGERIEAIAVVPSILQRMLAEPAGLYSLRCVISGGAALSPQLAIEVRKRLGDVLFNLYGTSEGGVAVFANPADLATAPDTIGREIWGVRVTIRDDANAIVPDGHLGRLCVESSAAVAQDFWIETGDVGLRDEQGRLFVHGRIDDMIVSGGENVNPWEVETVLVTHPEVREAAAVGVADPDFGQRLVAFVVPIADSALTPKVLSRWLAERVARYQRPRSIEFRAELPLTAVGKIDKRRLAREVGPSI